MNKIVIFGMGSIGRRYASILQSDVNIDLYAYREQGKDTVGNVKNIFSLEELHEIKPDIALITNPTSKHVETALKCAQHKMHLFIEKPLSLNMDKVKELKVLVKKNNLSCYVAYNMRFHPGISRLKQVLENEEFIYANVHASSYLPFWRKGKDYRQVYSAKKNMGGGIALDLSHEFDYVSYIFGGIEDLSGYLGKVSDLEIDCNDLADVRALVCGNKRVQIHLDFFSLNNDRGIRVITKEKVYKLDLIKNTLEIFKDNADIEVEKYQIDRNYTYEQQITYFLNNIGNKHIMNNLDESSVLLEKIINFKNEACEA